MDPVEGRGGAKTPEQEVADILPLEVDAAVARRVLGSRVEHRRLEASRLVELGEPFDFVFCLGILHRVTDPLGLLRLLRARLADGGRVLLETYGINHEDVSSAYIHVHRPGEVYA